MPQCVQCGRELPAISFGDAHDTCAECRAQAAPPPPVRRLPTPVVTVTLIAICVLLFGLMVLRGVSPTWPSGAELLPWGAVFGPLTLGGQWWRLLAANFLHFGLLHLALNMWVLWDMGRMAELVFGRATFLALYLLCGIASSVASIFWHPLAAGAGASGAIFGIAGALIAIFYLGRLPLPPRVLKSTLRDLVTFAVLNLAIGASLRVLNNAAHLGGLICGLVTGALLARLAPRTAPNFPARRAAVLAAVAAIILLCTLTLAHAQAYWAHAKRGEDALRAGQLDTAITELSQVVRQKPDLAFAHLMLGQAYGRKQDLPHAEAEFRRTLQLDPEDEQARYRLAWALLLQDRYADARPLLEQSLKAEPNNPDVYLGLGIIAAAQNDNQTALSYFQRATQLAPDDRDAHYNAGLAAMRLQQFALAAGEFEHAVRLAPQDASAYQQLGLAYRALGKPAESQAAFAHAAQLEHPR